MTSNGRMSVLQATPSETSRDILSARSKSDNLFRILKPETIYQRPIAERHRVIFYAGHLDAFDSIQVCREGLGLKSPDPELDQLFQAGIDPDSSHLPTDRPSDWPSLERVSAYVRRCRQRVDENLDRAPNDSVQMALEHRLMHLETLAYMFHNFPHEAKIAPTGLAEGRAETNPLQGEEWREIPAGDALLGKPEDDVFGWDNEYCEVREFVPAFRMQRFAVTNGEYLRFVKEGAPMPHFWVRNASRLEYRGMFANIPLPLTWPAYVTQAEAESYAAWLGRSLPSEAQFHRAAYGSRTEETFPFPWGGEQPSAACGNFDFKRWDPESVAASPAGDSAFGVRQLVGNGWEWTRTPFGPFPGFRERPAYPGYSANFFDGAHYVLKGGSARTASQLLRRSFRNWFRRDYSYMYAKFRCIEN